MVWLEYFDKPDGEDCFFKIWFASKLCGKIAGVCSVYDVIMYTKSPTVYDGIVRAGYYWMVPFVAMGATTAAITCSLASIRKKDDVLNYFVGGFAGGSIWGATYRSMGVGIGMGIANAVAVSMLKISHRDNWDYLMPAKNRTEYGSFRHYERDYTIMKDPKDAK